MEHATRGWGGAAVGIVLGWLAMGTAVWAGDVTTLSGTMFRDVRLVRAEPDGVTWEHATGVVKVDFADLPESVRREFHYDAAKATAFAAAQAKAQQQFAAQAQQAQREAKAYRVQRFQGQLVAASKPGEFVYRRKAADTADVDSVGGGIAARKAAADFRTRDDGTIWDRRLWAVPVFLLGGNPFNGVAFDPKTDFNSHEFQSSLLHGVVSDVKDSAGDGFFQPVYMTKSYNDDMDRAEAFARGKP